MKTICCLKQQTANIKYWKRERKRNAKNNDNCVDKTETSKRSELIISAKQHQVLS